MVPREYLRCPIIRYSPGEMIKMEDDVPSKAAGVEFGAVDLALTGVMLVWGGNMIAVKLALTEINPMAFNALRFALASVTMLTILLITERDLKVTGREWRWLLMTGLLGNTIYQVLFINGINLSTAGNTAFMVATSPMWVAVMSSLWGDERLTRRQWKGVLLSLVGAALVIFGAGHRIAVSSGTLFGDALTLVGAICWAGYTVMTRPALAHRSPLRVTSYAMALGSIPLVLVSIPHMRAQDWQSVSLTGWMMLLYGSLGALVIGYLVWGWGVRVIGSTRTAIYNNLTPVVAGVFGYIILAEQWTLMRGTGAAAILVGVYLVRSRGKSRRLPSQPAREGSQADAI